MSNGGDVPFSPEIEQDILGSVLTQAMGGSEGAESWWRFIEERCGEAPSLFHSPSTYAIASSIHHAWLSGEPVTQASVIDRISDTVIENPKSAIFDLVRDASINSLESLEQSLEVLIEKRSLRNQLDILDKITGDLKSGRLSSKEIADKSAELAEPVSSHVELRTLGTVLDDLANNPSTPWAVSTGFASLDESIRDGYEPGHVYVIGGRTKEYKSTFLMNNIDTALLQGAVVVLVTLEVPEIDVLINLSAIRSHVPLNTISQVVKGRDTIEGGMSEEQQIDYRTALGELRESPLYVVEGNRLQNGYHGIASHVLAAKAAHEGQPLILFIDYIQRLAATVYDRKPQILASYAAGLKSFAHQQGIPVVVAAQTSDRTSSSGTMPDPSEITDSAQIAKEASAVIMVNPRSSLGVEDEMDRLDLWIALSRRGKRNQRLSLMLFDDVGLLDELDNTVVQAKSDEDLVREQDSVGPRMPAEPVAAPPSEGRRSRPKVARKVTDEERDAILDV